MKKTILFLSLFCLIGLVLNSCSNEKKSKNSDQFSSYEKGSFGYDLDFLKAHQDIVVLKQGKAQIAIAPNYQGRVMTSTATGLEGMSFGWLNYGLIKSGEKAPQFNNYGGEERFWLGPEGGQFSIFFPPGVSFTFDNWQVPAPIDSEPFDLVKQGVDYANFSKVVKLINYSNFEFKVKIDRHIRLVTNERAKELLGSSFSTDLKWVGYQSDNSITNVGDQEWNKQNGLLSIWILGQYISSPTNTVLVPFEQGSESDLGKIVNDEYFGKVPSDRLTIADSVLYFKADGNKRSKIGLTPDRAKSFLGSYDSKSEVLSLVFFNKPEKYEGYVNSMWELQEKPFEGDIINSYNDGPLEDGSQMGPFYELETSSSAAALKPGRLHRHISTTFHITGSIDQVGPIISELFGASIDQIKDAFSN